MLKAKVSSAVGQPVGQTSLEALAILLITQGYNMITGSADTNGQLVGLGVAALGVVLMFLKYLSRQ
jgi:hypothetical protein